MSSSLSSLIPFFKIYFRMLCLMACDEYAFFFQLQDLYRSRQYQNQCKKFTSYFFCNRFRRVTSLEFLPTLIPLILNHYEVNIFDTQLTQSYIVCCLYAWYSFCSKSVEYCKTSFLSAKLLVSILCWYINPTET